MDDRDDGRDSLAGTGEPLFPELSFNPWDFPMNVRKTTVSVLVKGTIGLECSRCGNESGKPGICPYDHEINDRLTECICCDDCRHECAMDI
jgi:hypothetical protein